jgi:hypothetical protein
MDTGSLDSLVEHGLNLFVKRSPKRSIYLSRDSLWCRGAHRHHRFLPFRCHRTEDTGGHDKREKWHFFSMEN